MQSDGYQWCLWKVLLLGIFSSWFFNRTLSLYTCPYYIFPFSFLSPFYYGKTLSLTNAYIFSIELKIVPKMASQLSGTAGTLAANNQNYTTMLMHNFCFLFWKEIINKICFQNLTSWSTWIISMKLTFSNARTFVRNIYMICVFLRNKIWSILQSIYLTMNWKNYWIKGIFAYWPILDLFLL